jgi:hypothetical protein
VRESFSAEIHYDRPQPASSASFEVTLRGEKPGFSDKTGFLNALTMVGAATSRKPRIQKPQVWL